jgi:single-strand DNA-binding protein
MYDTVMTIVGNVVDEPRLRYTKNQHAVVAFRVASTSRRYDREQGRFVDDSTLFVNVSCWRALAENAFDSVHKGQRVIVSGRYYQREYTSGEMKRIRYELEANAIGHDLAWGTSRFTKVHRPPATGMVAADGSGAPVDDAEDYLASLDRDEAAQFATETFGSELDELHEAGEPLLAQ